MWPHLTHSLIVAAGTTTGTLPPDISGSSQSGISGLEGAIATVIGALLAAVVTSMITTRKRRRNGSDREPTPERSLAERISRLEDRMTTAEGKAEEAAGRAAAAEAKAAEAAQALASARQSTEEWRAEHSRATNDWANFIQKDELGGIKQRLGDLEGGSK